MIHLKLSLQALALCFFVLLAVPVQGQNLKLQANLGSEHSVAQDVQLKGMYALYEDNRQKNIPNYITEDLLLQAYSMQRAKSQVSLEKLRLLPALEQMLSALQVLLRGRDEPYAADNRLYLQVLQALLAEGELSVANQQVQAELQLIRRAVGHALSPLWGYRLDYSQFKVQGYYSDDPDLRGYFLASRYANSVLFPVVASAATGVTTERAERFAGQALQLSRLLQDPSVAPAFAQLSGSLNWQFGEADDLSADDVLAAARAGMANQRFADTLRAYAESHDKVPRILSLAMRVDHLEEALSAAQASIGWRLLPSRRSVDAQAMQRLVTDGSSRLGWRCGQCAQPALASAFDGAWHKAYPSYLELMAANGSAYAAAALLPLALTDYSGYSQQFNAIAGLYSSDSGLAKQQLSVLRAALGRDDTLQSLHSGAGFWLWQRYIAALYQKRSSTLYSKGVALELGGRSGAELAANTPLYRALASVAETHAAAEQNPDWIKLSHLLSRCAQISARLDLSLALSREEERFLNGLDRQLSALTGRDDAPIVVELHRNYQDRKVLQAALGRPKIATQRQARGARFHVIEFLVPIGQTFDNRSWRLKLQGVENQ